MSKRRLFHLSVALAIAVGAIATLSYLTTHSPGSEPKSASPVPQMLDKVHERKALAAELKKKPDHVPILLRLAELAREESKPAEAIQYLREALKVEPKNVEALLELGRALYESGDTDGALVETKRLVEIEPKNTDALYNLGAIYGNLNQPELARQYLTQAAKIAPESNGGKLARDALARLGP